MATQVQDIIRNEPVTLFSEQQMSKPGYKLAGWLGMGKPSSAEPDYAPGETVPAGFDEDNTDLYAVWKRDFSQCTMTISPTSYSYQGDDESYPIASVEKPAATVKDVQGNVLNPGFDYTLAYAPTDGMITSGRTATLSVTATPEWPDAIGTLTKTYTASYSQIVKYGLSFSSTDSSKGVVSATVNGVEVQSGERHDPYSSYAVTATGINGWQFLYWSTNSSQLFVNPWAGWLDESKSCNAVFAKVKETSSGNPRISKYTSNYEAIHSPTDTSYSYANVSITNNNAYEVTIEITAPLRTAYIDTRSVQAYQTYSVVVHDAGTFNHIRCREFTSTEPAYSTTDISVDVVVNWLTLT